MLASGRGKLLCPVCSTTAETVSRGPRFTAHRCGNCDHRFVHSLAEAVYGSGYEGYREDPVFRDAVRRYFDQHFSKLLKPPADILDIGCGNGVFLEIARERGYGVRGVDVSESAKALCKQKGISVAVGEFADLPAADLGNPQAITLWDVVEHLPTPSVYLRRAADILPAGGVLLVKVPATGELSFRLGTAIPRLSGALLHVPNHLQFFTESSMAGMLERSGFSEIQIRVHGSMRGAMAGGSLKRRTIRSVKGRATALSRDANFLALARSR